MKNYAAIILLTLVLQSCSSEYEDSMAQTQECLENKYDNGKGVSKYGSIDEALTSYDFESARNLLSCYEDECFANDRRQSNMCTEHRWLIARNPHYKQMYKIVKSEISYFLINNDEKRAKNTALESDLMFLYDEMKENYTSD